MMKCKMLLASFLMVLAFACGEESKDGVGEKNGGEAVLSTDSLESSQTGLDGGGDTPECFPGELIGLGPQEIVDQFLAEVQDYLADTTREGDKYDIMSLESADVVLLDFFSDPSFQEFATSKYHSVQYDFDTRERVSRDTMPCVDGLILSYSEVDCTYQLNFLFESYVEEFGCTEMAVVYDFELINGMLTIIQAMAAG